MARGFTLYELKPYLAPLQGFKPCRPQSKLLQAQFDCLIDSFIADKVGLSENFLEEQLAAQLKAHLIDLHTGQQFHAAGIGNQDIHHQDQSTRGDQIYWLDRQHQHPLENRFFELLDSFVLYLNQSCYTGITGYEFHYALYEKGSFYKRHLDQFRSDKSRAFSMILYLNEHWVPEDGGELCIYHPDRIQTIAPLSGQCVFFKSSELEHEVLLTHAPRMSITGWLKIG